MDRSYSKNKVKMKMKKQQKKLLNNPFNPRYPIKPELFVDRNEILDRFSAMLKRGTPDNIAVVGEWGVGKTSLLKKIEYNALNSKQFKVFTAFIEVTPETSVNFNTFIARTRDEIERSFKVVNAPLLLKLKKKLIPEWRLKTIKYGIGIEFKERKASLVTIFEDSLRELWTSLKSCGIDKVLLIFDDLHYLAEKSPDVLYDLRGIFQKLAMDNYNFSLAISGKEILFFKAKELAEPFTRFFDRFRLDMFNFEITKQAILKPIKLLNVNIALNEEVIKKIHSLTEGHPYFIHFIMQDLVNRCEGKVDLNFFNKNFRLISEHLAKDKFDLDFASASDAEREVLFALAEHKNKIIALNKIKANTSNPRRDITRLVEKNLVIRNDRGEYSLYHPLFKDYLKNKSTKSTKSTKK